MTVLRTGRFLVLDGPDGAGKSTQAARLVSWLGKRGIPVVHLRDPGSTRIGERVRELLLDPTNREMTPMAETLLFLAARAQLLEERILPALREGIVVVCERWLGATVCYQGYGGGIDPERIWRLGEASSGGLTPDLTLVLDVDARTGLSRIEGDRDLLEQRPPAYHERVRAGFRRIVDEGRLHSVLVPAMDVDGVESVIREEVENVLR